MGRLLLSAVIIFATIFNSDNSRLQETASTIVIPGEYEGLKLAYDSQTKAISGYFYEIRIGGGTEKRPQFSCGFYLKGKLIGNKAHIITYFPMDMYFNQNQDTIHGILEIKGVGKVALHLDDDPGGCLMTGESFSKETDVIDKEKTKNWLSINYITAKRSYFYCQKDKASIQKGYLLKGDIICVDKIDKQWVHCIYYSKSDYGIRRKGGWVEANTINAIN